ncbi:hypothetical protein Hanom_Chr00s000059g01618791 [Helianthus anomalus]
MAGGDDYSSERKLDQTPTWAVAGVCAIIIIVSIALEKVLHKLGKVVSFLNLLIIVLHSCSFLKEIFKRTINCIGEYYFLCILNN